ncbi:MAG: hypothetical protein KA712_18790 [Myxococcales bacterium]|nr:hypothetical protein [Myxococcales bacterium]
MGLFDWFRRDPAAELARRVAAKWEEAMQLQRRGKIVEYAEAVAEAERLQAELEGVKPPLGDR